MLNERSQEARKRVSQAMQQQHAAKRETDTQLPRKSTESREREKKLGLQKSGFRCCKAIIRFFFDKSFWLSRRSCLFQILLLDFAGIVFLCVCGSMYFHKHVENTPVPPTGPRRTAKHERKASRNAAPSKTQPPKKTNQPKTAEKTKRKAQKQARPPQTAQEAQD